uniref:Putative secreted protein n=1 Tax=Anopheles darlingi TaxID=43151 RepID=A0A2M4DE67_ANODA
MAYASTLLHLLFSNSASTSAVAVIASSVDVVRKGRSLFSRSAALHDYVSYDESDNGKGASFRGNALRESPHSRFRYYSGAPEERLTLPLEDHQLAAARFMEQKIKVRIALRAAESENLRWRYERVVVRGRHFFGLQRMKISKYGCRTCGESVAIITLPNKVTLRR